VANDHAPPASIVFSIICYPTAVRIVASFNYPTSLHPIFVNISVDFVDPILATAFEITVTGLDWSIKRAYPKVQLIFTEVETWRRKEVPPKCHI
jgi:hypothetical protein